jgi:hypothetical protein
MKPSSVFLADFIYYAIWAATLVLVLGPYWLLRIQHAPEIWQWTAMALAFALLVPLYWVFGVVQKKSPETFAFLGEAHRYAKQRRDLSLQAKNLTLLEYACFCGLLVLAVGAAIASAALLVNAAVFSAGPFRLAGFMATFAASILLLMPVLMTAVRMCFYFGLRIAARINRR